MKDVRVGTPIVVNDITITPLEQVSSFHEISADGGLVYWAKEPVGVLIETPTEKWALNVSGRPISLDAFQV